tara:strand:+ start:68 stop:751 length:684 start_codon:yes stop_codon:yes gene_type:complete
VDLTDPDNHVLADKPIEHARELARAMIDAELEARDVMAVRSKAIAKIVRHLNRKDVTAEAPALSAEEELEVERDMAHLDTIFPRFGLADLPLRQRLEAWKNLRKLDKGKRGTGAKELRPGIGAAAFALLNWRHARGEEITATLEATFPKSGPIPEGAVVWTFINKRGEEVERLYNPSKAVRWLASELCSLDPSLSGSTPRGRRPDWHVAYDWAQRWRDCRGLSKSSR